MQEQINTLVSEDEDLANSLKISFDTITSDFLNSRRGKFVKLLDSNEITFNLSKDGKKLVFNEPVFIKTVSFFSPKESTRPKVELIATFADNTKSEALKPENSKYAENRNFVFINNFVKELELSSSRMIRSENLSRIMILGLSSENFYKLLDEMNTFTNKHETLKSSCSKILEEINSSKSELDAQETSFNQNKKLLEDDIATLKSEIEEKQEAFEELSSEVASEEDKLKELKAIYAETQDKETKVSNSVEELTEKQSTLNRNISNLKDKVEQLTKRKDLYSEDMTGFNSESTNQLRIYYGLLALVIISLGLIGIDALEKINDLIKVYTYLKANSTETSGWDLIAMRIPYASIVLAAISALSLFGKTLVSKIFEINSQKRTMIGLSLLARDITFSATNGLDLADDDIVERRENLKFELLSESIVGGTFKSVSRKRKLRSEEDAKVFVAKSNSSIEEHPPMQ